METDVQLLQTWYDTWLVVAAFAVALVLTVLVAAKSSWGTGGLLVKLVMILSVLATLPLALVRLGMNRTFEDDTTVGYMSIAGAAFAIVVGLAYLLGTRSRSEEVSEEPEEVESGDIATPEQGVPMVSEDESATRTLSGGGTAVLDTGATMVEDVGTGAVQASPAWLMFRSGPRAGQSIPLSTEATRIGRGSENDVVVDDPAVSRQHATISFENGEYVVEDAGSSGGTLVEGVSGGGRTVLSSGSTVQLGETELVFMQSESAAPAAGTSTGDAGPGRPGETMIVDQPFTVMAWLAVTSGSDKGKTLQLKDGETTIGRGQENDLVIADAAVSRGHAMVKHQEGSFVVVDLGSGGGTKVNNQPVGGKMIRSGSTSPWARPRWPSLTWRPSRSMRLPPPPKGLPW